MTQLSLVPRALAEDPDDLRAREADYTPRPAVRQCVERILSWGWDDRSRTVDLCAGAGVWTCELRRALVRAGTTAHVTAVELHEPDGMHLVRLADSVILGPAEEWLAKVEDDGETFDAVIGNPAFTLAVPLVPRLCRIARHVWLLGTAQQYSSSADGREVLRRHAVSEHKLGGRLSFREDGKTDSRDVSLWQFAHNGSGSWRGYVLPDLPTEARRWTVRPGTEYMEGLDPWL